MHAYVCVERPSLALPCVFVCSSHALCPLQAACLILLPISALKNAQAWLRNATHAPPRPRPLPPTHTHIPPPCPQGDCIGERALMSEDGIRMASVMSVTPLKLIVVDKATFTQLIKAMHGE